VTTAAKRAIRRFDVHVEPAANASERGDPEPALTEDDFVRLLQNYGGNGQLPGVARMLDPARGRR
jgi:hypothetical protein